MFTEVLQNDANSADVEFGNEQRKIVQILQILTMLQMSIYSYLVMKIGFDTAQPRTSPGKKKCCMITSDPALRSPREKKLRCPFSAVGYAMLQYLRAPGDGAPEFPRNVKCNTKCMTWNAFCALFAKLLPSPWG